MVMALCFVVSMLTGCSTQGNLQVKAVTYQSINTKKPQVPDNTIIPKNISILAFYAIDESGNILVSVQNPTDEIMIIDNEKSYFINGNGKYSSYYDPTISIETASRFSSITNSASVNIGSIASAFGVGGSIETLLSGVTAGKSTTSGEINSSTTITQRQKQTKIGPRGRYWMPMTFTIKGIGKNKFDASVNNANYTYQTSPTNFKVCISYSLDDGETFDTLETDFYASSYLYIPVTSNDMVNKAMRNILSSKTDILDQPWYLLHIQNNLDAEGGEGFFIPAWLPDNVKYDTIIHGMLMDYK